MGRTLVRVIGGLVLAAILFVAGWLVARTGMGTTVNPASLSDLERQFTERMRGAVLNGSFTLTGREDRPLRPDRYEIASAEKVGDGLWRFSARLVHEGTDVTLPIVVPMQWHGDTPVISMTDYSIPGLGTFTCRVFFYGDRYAGTWQHGDRGGGHMFGTIERSSTDSR
jgi:hypothetical protein